MAKQLAPLQHMLYWQVKHLKRCVKVLKMCGAFNKYKHFKTVQMSVFDKHVSLVYAYSNC